VTSDKRFKHYPNRPKRLTAAFAKKEYTKLLERLDLAEMAAGPERWLSLFADWNALSSYIGSEAARNYFEYSQDMTNKKLNAEEKYFREKISPAINKPEHKLATSFLASKHRDAIAKKYGKQLIPAYETAMKPLDPVNTALGIKAGNLVSRYDQIIAKATVKINGQKMSLWQARSLQFSDDESIRKEAYLVCRDWFLANHQKLAGIYDKLVKLRTQMGKNVGYSSYTPLAYEMRGRTDYNAEMIEQFRSYVRKYFVPLYKKQVTEQTKDLEAKSLKPWDMFYNPKLTLPLGIAPVGEQLDKAQKVFNKISPKLGKHFKYMRLHNLIDLENRPNKRSGAYCIDFPDENKVAVFCNSTGDPDDISTLTHEMGHAFQGWESLAIESVDLQSGTADLAEVYSMGMEFLTMPYLNEFFTPEQTSKFSKERWRESIYSICYMSVVDEFQHWVYANPDVSISERDRTWCRIWDTYLPGVDFKGLEKYKKTRWYAQAHIFGVPFYYIDYALAEICAQQLALISQKDHQKAVNIYLKLCKVGGTKSFLEAIEYGGLDSPFSEDVVRRLAANAARHLI
jgi:M3 family oligoendopeptidase